jgi:hypothetical protein
MMASIIFSDMVFFRFNIGKFAYYLYV